MSFLSFLGKKKEEIALLIDIGNGSMGGAFVLFRDGHIPKLLYSLRLPFTVGNKPDSSKISDNMATLLDELLSNMMKRGFRGESVLVTFSSPWFISKTKHIHLEKDTPFTITRTFIDDITEKEQKIFKNELSKNSDNKSIDFNVVERSVLHTKINGYTLKDSIGKKTKIFDAFLCMSVVDSSVENKVLNLILKHTHITKEKVLIHTFPVVSFSTIRDLFWGISNFIIIDVTGEVTDITLVMDDVINKTVSFPSGKNFVIRQIAKTLNISPEIAVSMLHMHISGKANDSANEQMQKVFVDIEKEWSIYFEDALTELSPNIALPENVYVTSDPDISELFVEFLKLPNTDATSVWQKNININVINEEILAHMYENNSIMLPDEFIGILAIFYDKIFKSTQY